MAAEECASDNAALDEWANEIDVARIFGQDYPVSREKLQKFADIEIQYQGGHFQSAYDMATSLLSDPEAPVVIQGFTMRVLSSVQLNRPEQAYIDLLKAKDLIEAGLLRRDDSPLYAASVLCGIRLENIMQVDLFDLPEMSEGADFIPIGLKCYFGYLQVIRSIRHGRFEAAAGMSHAFQMVVGKKYPGARMFLDLATAVSDIVMGQPEDAATHFGRAWEFKRKYGIVAPFIELCSALLGLPRYYFESVDTDEYRAMDAMVRRYRGGWSGLRRKFGMSDATYTLTDVECYVAGLAVLGWRNKEIASYLGISGNTVKHYLSSIYQKLHVSNRAELRKYFSMMGYFHKSSSPSITIT